jgi:hypothetical protein
VYVYFRHPFVNTEGKFSLLKLATGKYDLIEGKDVDEKLKELSYKMIKLVLICVNFRIYYVYLCIYEYTFENVYG